MEKTDTALIILDVQVHMFLPENPVYRGEQLLEKRCKHVPSNVSTGTKLLEQTASHLG